MSLSEKKKAQMRAYYWRNKEKLSKYHQKYRLSHKDQIGNKQKEWYTLNKKTADAYHATWRASHRQIIRERNRKRRERDEIKTQEAKYRRQNKDKIHKRRITWLAANKDKVQKAAGARFRQRMKDDLPFRMRVMCRSRLRSALLSQKARKSSNTFDLIGCTVSELMRHLKMLFLEGMTWDNYGHGRGKWNIDHIIPCALFDLSDPGQQRRCFHYTNLQPLWAEENWAKHNKMPSPVQSNFQKVISPIQPAS